MSERFDADKVQAERRASIARRKAIRKQILTDQARRDAEQAERDKEKR